MKDKQILFAGKWSYDDLGVEITAGGFGDPPPRIIRESLAGMDGSYNFSRLDGKLHFDDRKGSYTFCIRGRDAKEVSNIKAAVISWLDSDCSELYDEHEDGYIYTGVSCTGTDEPKYIGNRTMLLTAHFTAAPYMRSRSGQETTCCDITPDASPAYYLFSDYTSGGVEYYYLSRMKRASSSAPPSGSTVTYDEITSHGSVVAAYPHITFAAATAPAYYMMPPKSTSGTSIYVDESTLTGGSIVSGGIEGYTYLKQNAGEALSFRINGYDPTTLRDSTSRNTCTMQIRYAAWYYPADSGTVRFRKNLIPNTDRMQILSEAEPAVRLNPPYYGTVDPVDINDFALAEYDLIRIESAENELCRLRYNSVKYRR